MMAAASVPQVLRTLAASLPRRRKLQLRLLVGLMLASALAEVVSLGAVVPFLAFLVDPQAALASRYVSSVVGMLGVAHGDDLRWQFTLIFATAAVVAGVLRFLLVYATARLNFGIGHELGARIFRKALFDPYEVHVNRNSSEVLGGIGKVDQVVWVIFGLLNLVSAALIAFVIVAVLLLIDPMLAIFTMLSLTGIYATVNMRARRRLHANSGTIAEATNERVQIVQEGLNGIRDVVLHRAQRFFAERFERIDAGMRRAQASNNIIGPSPRFAVEALGMVLIAFIAYFMTQAPGGVENAIPSLGALALGTQRLMPLIQQVYQGWVLVSGNQQLLREVAGLVESSSFEDEEDAAQPLRFEREIRLELVSFRYQGHLPLVLDRVDLRIPKGSRVGIIGATGCGKSSLLDLIMGLLAPSEGRILVDDTAISGAGRVAWQRNIGHVPQAIYLADASFAENIAFGVPADRIDMARVKDAARQARIDGFIEEGADGYWAVVGERGVRLSGGQRQRIAIARALYRRAPVLVFDEATSALDGDTESAVISSILSLDRELTIFMVAHRTSTLDGCDLVVEISGGRIAAVDDGEPA